MTTKKTYRWGIIGPGKIAATFAAAVANVPGAELYAVASRDAARAKHFAGQYGAQQHYDSYKALAQDDRVDAVYVATPHTFHYAHTLLCLQHKKAVLCEKPMSVNYRSTLEMVNTARENNVFLMEAMWTRFLPAVVKTLEFIEQGVIGEVKYLRADFGFPFVFDASSRIFDLKLGGGALLDIGVYPLFIALCIMGKPDELKAFTHLAVTGADEFTHALLYYNNGRMADISCTVAAETPVVAEITGTKGIITLQSPWYKTTAFTLHKQGEPHEKAERFSFPYTGNGFEFEIMEVMRCLDNDQTESKLMPLDFSLLSAGIVQEICDQCDLRYDPVN